jgi:vacuolar-type H+-ATPase subunit H
VAGRQEVTSIDILFLVDRLEAVLQNGQRVPFTHKVMIDETECYDIIDQMRLVVPEEVKAAKKLSQDRDRVQGEAEAQAERILQDAMDQRDEMLAEYAIVAAAEERRVEILDDATQEAEEIKAEADRYALDVLEALSARVGMLLREVDNGISALQPPPEDGD